MALSGVICTIKLDPFYQAFLFRQFGYDSSDPVFSFPKGNELQKYFKEFLSIPPLAYRGEDHGGWTFKIEIPHMEHKNPKSYRYISEKQQGNFQSRVRGVWQLVAYESFKKDKLLGLSKNEIIQKLMDDFDFEEKYRDRIDREYSRYLLSLRLARYRKKKCVKVC